MNNYELAVNTAKKIQEDLEKFYIQQDIHIRELRESLEALREMFVKLGELDKVDNPIGFSDEEETGLKKELPSIYHACDNYDEFMSEALENGYSEDEANCYFEDLTNKYSGK